MQYDRDSTFGKPEYYGKLIGEAKTLAVSNGYNLIRELSFNDMMKWPEVDHNYVCSRITFATLHGRVLRAVVC